jgi:hypothetical protein
MKKYLLLFLALFIIFLVSCKKDVTELPPATQTGANTFGCKVDGNFWVPAGFGIISTAPILEARLAGNSLFLNARNFSSSPTETEFELYVQNITAPGVYQLNTTLGAPNPFASYAYYVHRKITPDNEWMTSAEYTGTVNITRIDTVNLIISGTFEFRAINLYNAPQPMTVTDGRFDVKAQ